MDIIFTLLLLYYLPTILTALVMLSMWALVVGVLFVLLKLLPFIALVTACTVLYRFPAWHRNHVEQERRRTNLLPHARACRCEDCRSSEEGYRLNHPPDPVKPALPVRALTVRDADDWNPYDRSSWSS